MSKEDIFRIGERSKNYFSSLEDGTFSPNKQDNVIIKKFIEAKFQGNYRHIIYDCNCPEKTVYKNIVVLKKIIDIVNKPLVELTEDDIIRLQNKLNQNQITITKTNKPISSSYKKDIVKVFKQFWTFYRAYAKHA